MKAPAVPLLPVHAEVAAHQELAAAVLHQAIIDLRDPRAPVRESAKVFLGGSDSFRGWCSVAGLTPDVVIAHARRLLSLGSSAR